VEKQEAAFVVYRHYATKYRTFGKNERQLKGILTIYFPSYSIKEPEFYSYVVDFPLFLKLAQGGYFNFHKA
jgi:hypothetical protein